jgi:hypothetical protein
VVANVVSVPSFTLRWLPEFMFMSTGLSNDEHTHLQSLAGVEVEFVEAHDHLGFVKDRRCKPR